MCSLEQIVGGSNSVLTDEMQNFVCGLCSKAGDSLGQEVMANYYINVASMEFIVAVGQVDDESQ